MCVCVWGGGTVLVRVGPSRLDRHRETDWNGRLSIRIQPLKHQMDCRAKRQRLFPINGSREKERQNERENYRELCAAQSRGCDITV